MRRTKCILRPVDHEEAEKRRVAIERRKEQEERLKWRTFTMKTIALSEYKQIRSGCIYRSSRAPRLKNFWSRNQAKIHKEVYLSFAKKVCPMKALNLEKMATDPYFYEMIWVTRKLGLHHLMKLRHDYDEDIILQFFATLCYDDYNKTTLHWMTGDKEYSATWRKFAGILGCSYRTGAQIHSVGEEPVKQQLAPLYNAQGVAGHTKDLLPLYDILMRAFRSSISPCAGNSDAIRGGLVNLLAYSYSVFHCGEVCEHNHEIDVMSFIYEELEFAIMNRKCPPYAPYIMKLICAVVKDQGDLLANAKVHKFGNLVHKDAHIAPADNVGFGAPADQPQVFTSAATRQQVNEKVSKLPWVQRLLIGGMVQNHKENYAAYVQGRKLSRKFDALSEKLTDFFNDARSRAGQAPWPPSPHQSDTSSRTIPYEDWNNGDIHWTDLEDVSSAYKKEFKNKGKEPIHVECEVSEEEEEGGSEGAEDANSYDDEDGASLDDVPRGTQDRSGGSDNNDGDYSPS